MPVHTFLTSICTLFSYCRDNAIRRLQADQCKSQLVVVYCTNKLFNISQFNWPKMSSQRTILELYPWIDLDFVKTLVNKSDSNANLTVESFFAEKGVHELFQSNNSIDRQSLR